MLILDHSTPAPLRYALKGFLIESSDYDNMEGGLFFMEKDTIVARTPPPPKEP
jgi:hypothetical protein